MVFDKWTIGGRTRPDRCEATHPVRGPLNPSARAPPPAGAPTACHGGCSYGRAFRAKSRSRRVAIHAVTAAGTGVEPGTSREGPLLEEFERSNPRFDGHQRATKAETVGRPYEQRNDHCESRQPIPSLESHSSRCRAPSSAQRSTVPSRARAASASTTESLKVQRGIVRMRSRPEKTPARFGETSWSAALNPVKPLASTSHR
jgi:hypothetical protein